MLLLLLALTAFHAGAKTVRAVTERMNIATNFPIRVVTDGYNVVTNIFSQGVNLIQIPGAPLLSTQWLRDDSVRVSWSLPATGYMLDEWLGTTGFWSQVTYPYTTNVTEISITVNPPVGERWYRLRPPRYGMTLIPAGEFTMGNSVADPGIRDADPMRVTVSAFYMETNLVTLGQWKGVYQWATNHGYDLFHGSSRSPMNHPVRSMDWHDCLKWCNARSQLAWRTPVYYTDAGLKQVYSGGEYPTNIYVNWSASGYRLPTEAEWEKAARGGWSGQRFPWGSMIDQSLANYYGNTGYHYDRGPNGLNPIASRSGSTTGTSAVGSFPPNGYGLCDMAGNLFQWCWDRYGRRYAGGTDPRGPEAGSYRVLRGGSWGLNADYCRTADRHFESESGFTNSFVGFRCVMTTAQ